MATVAPSSSPDIGAPYLHTAWIFQAIASFPTAFVLGVNVFDSIFSQYYLRIYRFITYTFNTLFASAIIFIVLVQWSLVKRGIKNHRMTFNLEVSKAVIATVMWVWLLLDSIFYDPKYYREEHRGKRIAVAAISVILVLVIFYPTAVYAAYVRKSGGVSDEQSGGRAGTVEVAGDENTPLLAERA